jgi:hypothetical protein
MPQIRVERRYKDHSALKKVFIYTSRSYKGITGSMYKNSSKAFSAGIIAALKPGFKTMK